LVFGAGAPWHVSCTTGTVDRRACQICLFLWLVGLSTSAWAQFFGSRSKTFKAGLAPDGWRSRRCWVALDDVRSKPSPIKIHSRGQVIVMRHCEAAERSGRKGFDVEEHVLLRDGQEPPSSLCVPKALNEVSTKIDFFGLPPTPLLKLNRGAVQGVLESRPRNSSEACHAALRGMARAAGDPYTSYLEPAEFRALNSRLEGKQRGYGMCYDSKLRVVGTQRGSPAQGVLHRGDRLVAIDGKRVGRVEDFRSLRLGESAVFTVRRGGKLRSFRLVAGSYRESQVSHRRARGNIGVVQIRHFEDKTASDVMRAIHEMGSLEGLVLDLRSNGGGSVEEARKLLNLFIPKGALFRFRQRLLTMKEEEVFRASPREARFRGLPLAVLVDGNTASASEIVAGAIAGRGRGVLVGQRTFGKGIGQGIFPLKAGGGLVLTTKEIDLAGARGTWQSYHGRGLTPHITVDPGKGEGDPALAAAAGALSRGRWSVVRLRPASAGSAATPRPGSASRRRAGRAGAARGRRRRRP
jgi:carboxyl-terminal processing protease